MNGIKVSEADLAELTRADVEAWTRELPGIRAHYEKFGDRLPQGLRDELAALEKRLESGAVSASR